MLHAQACLFMCEADNVCYAIGLGEKVRARVEAAGRIELAEHDRAQLVQTKAAFTVALFLAIPIFVAAQPMGTAPTLMSTDLFFLAGGAGAALRHVFQAAAGARRRRKPPPLTISQSLRKYQVRKHKVSVWALDFPTPCR